MMDWDVYELYRELRENHDEDADVWIGLTQTRPDGQKVLIRLRVDGVTDLADGSVAITAVLPWPPPDMPDDEDMLDDETEHEVEPTP